MSNKEEMGLGLTHTKRPTRLVNRSDNNGMPINISNKDTDNIATDISVGEEKMSPITEFVDNNPLPQSDHSSKTMKDIYKETLIKTESETPVEVVSELAKDNLEIIRQAKVNEELKSIEKSNLEVVKDSSDDNLWIKVPNVPSNGKVYDTNGTISYKRYTFGDFEDANNPSLDLQDKYTLLLQGIRCTSLESNLLIPFCDFNYISILRRLESQGSREFTAPYTCNTCGQIGYYNFKLEDIGHNMIERSLPIKVRLYSYPEEVFTFNLPTIGDIISLLQKDKYYRKNGEEYIVDSDGSYVIDDIAVLASSCTSHKYKKAYKLLTETSNVNDYNIIKQVQNMLDPGITNFEFSFMLMIKDNLEDEELEKENDEKLNFLRDCKGNMPSFISDIKRRNKGKHRCGAKNYLNIVGGNIYFFPFRESGNNAEYGILSV